MKGLPSCFAGITTHGPGGVMSEKPNRKSWVEIITQTNNSPSDNLNTLQITDKIAWLYVVVSGTRHIIQYTPIKTYFRSRYFKQFGPVHSRYISVQISRPVPIYFTQHFSSGQ